MLSEKPWKLMPLAVAILVMGMCFLAFSGIEVGVLHHNGQKAIDENSLLQVLLVVLTIHGSILLGTATALWWFDLPWREAFGFSTKGKPLAILMGLMAAAIFLPIGVGLRAFSAGIMTYYNLNVPDQMAVVTMQNAQRWDTRAVLIIFAVVIAPVAEEVLFRGILYPAIKQTGRKWMALFGTSLLFAAFHGSLPVLLPLFVLALMLTWLYERTDNLLAPITAHAAFNAINVAFLYYGDAISDALTRYMQHQ